MPYTIIDKAEEMLTRIERVVERTLDDAQAPDPDMDASTQVMQELAVARLTKEVRDKKSALIETFTPEQQCLWEAYQAIRASNKKAITLDDPTYDKDAERNAKKRVVNSLVGKQKELYTALKNSRRDLERSQSVNDQISINNDFFGIKPSDQMTIGYVIFSKNNTNVENHAIQTILNDLTGIALASAGQDSHIFPDIDFISLHDDKNNLVGLKIIGNMLDKDTVPKILGSYRRTLATVRDEILPKFNKRWEKLQTNRGTGYCYVVDSNFSYADPVYNIANGLAGQDKTLNIDRQLLYRDGRGKFIAISQYEELPKSDKKGCKRAIVLTGAAAKRVLVDEFGLDLRKIPEAKHEKGR